MSFDHVPSTLRVPGTYTSVDPTVAQSGPGVYPLRTLIIGQRIAAGTVAAEVVQRTTRASQAREEHGPGSFSHLMAEATLAMNPLGELDVVSLEDAGGSVAAAGIFTVGGTIATPGTMIFYVGGVRLQALAQTDADTTAAAMAAAINAEPDLPVTASAITVNCTVTAKNKGTRAEQIDLRVNHLPGEELPGSLTMNITAMTGGSGDPDISDVFDDIAGTRYDVIIHPFTDTANLAALEAEILARAAALVGDPGLAITGETDTQANLATLGDGRNSEWSTIVGMESFPGVSFVRAAAVAGSAARFLQEDPVRPLTNRQALPGYGPSDVDKFTQAERDLLLHDGISTTRFDRANTPYIERLITTYQETAGGSPDESFLDVQTMFGLSYLRRDYDAHFSRQFPNHKIADDGTVVRAGSVTLTPGMIFADAVAWYQTMIRVGICEDLDTFKSESFVQRAQGDPIRVEIALAVNLQNQLRIGAVVLRFRR